MRKSFKSARSPDSSDGAFGESERRELARRSSAGVDVTLYWHPALDELIVRVCDERHGAYLRSALSATWHSTSITPRHTPTSKTWSRRRTVLLRREVGQERLIVPAEGAH
jgi:hypothetical protein